MPFGYKSLHSWIIYYNVTIQCCAYDRYTTSPHLFEGDAEDAFIRVRNKVWALHILLNSIPAIVNITHMHFAISIARWKSHFMVVIVTLMLFWLLVLWILLLNQVWRYDYRLVRFCLQFRVSCFLLFLTAQRVNTPKSSK
jgi:hypothetical protein